MHDIYIVNKFKRQNYIRYYDYAAAAAAKSLQSCVITFDCCGSPELVDEDSGYIIKENDAEDLLKKLDLLKKQALQFNVLEKQKKFDKKTCYQKYLDVYKN